MLAELQLRQKVETVWAQLQDPVRVSDDPETYFTFQPHAVGFSGINVQAGILTASVSLSGETGVVVGAAPAVDKVPLLPLEATPVQDGSFVINLPIRADYARLIALMQSHYPNGYSTDAGGEDFPGTLYVDRVLVDGQNGALRVAAALRYDNRANWLKFLDPFGWFDFEGVAYFAARPVVEEGGKAVRLDDLAFDASTSSGLANVLVDMAQSPIIVEYLKSISRYDFSAEVDAALAEANSALAFPVADIGQLTGNIVDAGISAIDIGPDAIGITVRTSGTVTLDVGI